MGRLIDKEVQSAQAYASAGKKREALECVKRKRIYEKEHETLLVQKLNLMQQEQTLNALKFNTIVITAEEGAASAIEKEIKKVNGPEGVEKVQDRLDDAMADAADVLGATSRPMGDAAGMEDADLLEELEQMQLADLTSTLVNTSTAREEAELAALRDTMAPVPQPVPQTVPHSAPSAHASRKAPMRAEQPMPAPMGAMMMKMESPMSMPMMAACY